MTPLRKQWLAVTTPMNGVPAALPHRTARGQDDSSLPEHEVKTPMRPAFRAHGGDHPPKSDIRHRCRGGAGHRRSVLRTAVAADRRSRQKGAGAGLPMH